MSRRARGEILYDRCYAHVYSRTLEKQFVYRDDEDFEYFRKLLRKTKLESGYRLHHYCLMNTHFHIVVSIGTLSDFSNALKELKQSYANWVQNKYRRKGPVWWGRFGSQLIENEKYLYACGLYIEMNPVTARMVTKPEDWRYSSSQYYFLGQKDDLVDDYDRPSSELANQLAEGLNVGRGSYIGTPSFLFNGPTLKTCPPRGLSP